MALGLPDRSRSACIANLKQVNGAQATWALEQKKNNTDSPADADLFANTQYIRSSCVQPATLFDEEAIQFDR